MSTTKTSAETKAKTSAETKEKTVIIRIPRTKEDNSDVYVSVNDRTWLIKRGQDVEVPECVAEVLRHQERMLEQCYEFTEANKG